ncbi:hypothetical protein GCM10010109_31970 [Actinoplanes campanulatus]|nr:hypothetical protein GCM10010109_31970 [Actinoplanes campanulatus]GID38439.1 hypothetical protein Aca09nite_49450 [Actinoplanes campanulatus]
MELKDLTTDSSRLSERIVIAQLAAGVLDYAAAMSAGKTFRLPYPPNLQLALDRLTMVAWQQNAEPPSNVVELLQLAARPFESWPIRLSDADVDPGETLLAYGRPSVTCEELGGLGGDVAAEMRQNALMLAVMDKTRAAGAPDSYVAFRRLLIERPAITALGLDARLADPELAVVADELRLAYPEAPPEARADGIVRTCGGCNGLRLPLDDDRTWVCEDYSCPAPGTPGPDHSAAEGVHWLRRELRTFVTGPGRAELRIAEAIEAMGVPVQLWPDFDSCDLAVFADRPWVADIKAWRNPTRLGRALRERMFRVPPEAEKAYIVIGSEQVRMHPRYVAVLRRACPALKPGKRVTAVAEKQFLDAVRREVEARR